MLCLALPHDCESELLLLMIVDVCERTSISLASTMAKITSLYRLEIILGIYKLRQLLKNLHSPGAHLYPMMVHRLVDPLAMQPRKHGRQRMEVAMTIRFLNTTSSAPTHQKKGQCNVQT